MFNNVILLSNISKGDGDVLILFLIGLNKIGFGWGVVYIFMCVIEVSGLILLIVNLGWFNCVVFNLNEEVVVNFVMLICNCISGNVNWFKVFFGKYKIIFGMFYEGCSGYFYSWMFNNDVNGDGVVGNDLFYILKGVGFGEVLFCLFNISGGIFN